MEDKDFVSKYGLFSTIVVTVIGVGIFSYPRDLAKSIGTDGWIITLITGFISFVMLLLIYRVVKINDYKDFYEILEINLKKFFAKIVAIIFVAYNIFSMAIGMRVFTEVIKMYLLEKTPTEFILIVMIITGTYLVRGEIKNIVKFNEVSFWVMFLPMILVFLFAIKGADFTNIFPIFNNKPIKYIQAIRYTIYSFSGFQIAYLILPYLKNKSNTKKVIFKSMAFITLFYVLIVVFTLATFSEKQVETLLWPTITMIKSIDIPGSFVERWEGVVMSIWVIFYFTTFVNNYYFSSDIIRKAFNLEDVKISSIFIVPLVYIIAIYPENIVEVYDISRGIINMLSAFNLIILPIILLLLSGGKKANEK